MKINNKFFTKSILLILSIFILFHAIIWNLYTKRFYQLDDKIISGDLSRMAYDIDIIRLRKPEKIKFFTFDTWDKKAVDVLTIGDSFSNGQGGAYYQNYLVKNKKLRVLNIQKIKSTKNFIETIVALNNSDLMKKINPKSIIIESVQRDIMHRFGKNINFDTKIKNIEENLNISYIHDKLPKITLINKLNYNALKYNILYNFDDRAYSSKVYKVLLNKNLFTGSKPNTLLFYYGDIKNIAQTTKDKIVILNNNFNHLSNILSKQNIDLYLMPAVNKYELYSKYIINSKYPKDIFFEEIDTLEKKYKYIDTKKILQKELKNSKKDIFWADDTHWTTKAIEVVFSDIKFKKH